jgi:hypothetical protein
MEIRPINFFQNKKTIKTIIIGLFLFLLAGSFYIFSSFSNKESTPLISVPLKKEMPTPTPIRAEMYTQPLTVEVTQNKRFDIDVTLDAHNTVINGADSIIEFDPNMLKVVRISPPSGQTVELSLMRHLVEGNKIILTAFKSEVTENPTQEVVIARITLLPIKAGTTTLTFEHFPGTTKGSTIIKTEGSQNILDKVTNTTVIIK